MPMLMPSIEIARRAVLIASISVRDLAHAWPASVCLALGVTAALAPLLLLFGLNFGFVNGLIEQLRTDPRILELRPVGQHELTESWFDQMAADPRVAFVLPRTRYLASSATLRADSFDGVLDVELVPSAPGDPLVEPAPTPVAWDSVVLSASAAATANVEAGGDIVLQIFRMSGERRENVRRSFQVAAVLDRGLMERDAVLTSPAFVDAVERWREGAAVPTLDWPGDAAVGARQSYASFRLFARDVRDVPSLRDDVVAMGIDVRTRAESIASALAIEKGLGWVFAIVTALVSAGFVVTLALHLAAAVIERARELAILRLLGFGPFEVSLIPFFQGLTIAFAGSVAAALAILLAQPLLNARLAQLIAFPYDLSDLRPAHAFIAVAAASLAGAGAGVVAGWQAAKLEPSDGLHRE